MIKLKLGKVEAGMVLSQSVKDINGRVLLSVGLKLNEKHLKILKAWGVTDVAVEEAVSKQEGVSLFENIDPAAVEKIEREMKGMFRHADLRHPAVRELFNLCVARKLKAQEQGKG